MTAETSSDAGELAEAIDPFARFYKMQEPLNPPDDAPIAGYIPGIWPTMGELKRLIIAAARGK